MKAHKLPHLLLMGLATAFSLAVSGEALAEFQSRATNPQGGDIGASTEDQSPGRLAAIKDIAMEKGIEDGRADGIATIERAISPVLAKSLDIAYDTSHLYLEGGRVRPGLVLVTANGTKSVDGKSVEETRIGYKLMEGEKFTSEKLEWRDVFFRRAPSVVVVPTVLQTRTAAEEAVWQTNYQKGFLMGRELAVDEVSARIRWMNSRVVGMYDWSIAALPGGVLKKPQFQTTQVPIQGDEESLSVGNTVHSIKAPGRFKVNKADYTEKPGDE